MAYQKNAPSKSRERKSVCYLIISNLLVIVDQIVLVSARKPYSAELTKLEFTPVPSTIISALTSVRDMSFIDFKAKVHAWFKIFIRTIRHIVPIFVNPIDKTNRDTVFSLLPTIPSGIRLYLTLEIFCHTYQNTSFLLQSLIFRLLIYL